MMYGCARPRALHLQLQQRSQLLLLLLLLLAAPDD
jgi:hypothetical protein